MRGALVLATVVLLCGSCAVGGFVSGVFGPGEWEEKGAQQARDDIADGRPAIRSDALVLARSTHVDMASGLPTEDWSVHCGTGYDWDRHEGLVQGYNAVIREALRTGQLDGFRVVGQLRGEGDVKARFDTDDVVRLGAVGEGFDTPDGRYRIELRKTASDVAYTYVFATDTGTSVERQLANAYPHVDVAVLDDGATLLIRSGRGWISSYDLRSGREIQVVD